MKRNKWRALAFNVMIIIPVSLLLFSGLSLQLNYHLLANSPGSFYVGMNKAEWSMFHKLMALFSLSMAIVHVLLQKKWIWAVLAGKLKNYYAGLSRQYKTTVVLFYLSIPAVLTGMFPWLHSAISLNDGMDTGSFIRFHFIEIHDKLGLILVILLTIHVVQHWRRMLSHVNGVFVSNKAFGRGRADCVAPDETAEP